MKSFLSLRNVLYVATYICSNATFLFSEKLVVKLQTSQEIQQTRSPFDELCAFLFNQLDTSPLDDKILASARKVLTDEKCDAFQKYIAMRFLSNRWADPVYFQSFEGAVTCSYTNFNLLNFDPIHVVQLLNNYQLMKENYFLDDSIYMQKVISDEQAYDLYKTLNDEYTDFIYFPFNITTDDNDGFIIASRISLSDFILNDINSCNNNRNRKFIDDSEENAYYNLISQTSILHEKRSSPSNPFKILIIKSRRNRDEDYGYGVEGRITRKWGGKNDNSKWEGSITGEFYDGKGNYAEAEVKQNDQGEGSADVRMGYENKKK